MGENGAGKSTLMKIFSGVDPDYAGVIHMDGQEVRFASVRDAEAAGVAIIHQELNLVPELNVAENIFLGREPLLAGLIVNRRKAVADARALLDRLGIDLDPETRISSLRVGEQQLVEIAKGAIRLRPHPDHGRADIGSVACGMSPPLHDHPAIGERRSGDHLYFPPNRGSHAPRRSGHRAARRVPCRHQAPRRAHPGDDHRRDGGAGEPRQHAGTAQCCRSRRPFRSRSILGRVDPQRLAERAQRRQLRRARGRDFRHCRPARLRSDGNPRDDFRVEHRTARWRDPNSTARAFRSLRPAMRAASAWLWSPRTARQRDCTSSRPSATMSHSPRCRTSRGSVCAPLRGRPGLPSAR